MARPTIMDVAQAAGVSKSAVSFALNGRPGVSEATRERIVRVAGELGWRPPTPPPAAGAIGLALCRPPRTLGIEPFFMELISGVEAELARHAMALVVQTVPTHELEIEAYRRWHLGHRVDGVLVVDPLVDDDRPARLAELGLPAVFIGMPGPGAIAPPAGVWSDDAAAMSSVLEYLVRVGHRQVAYVTADGEREYVRVRSTAFREQSRRLGLAMASVMTTDLSQEEGAAATRQILSESPRCTAVIYDNSVMALAGLGVANARGVRVPEELSIMAWDDSTICEAAYPALTALRRDIPAFGGQATALLLEMVAGGRPRVIQMPASRLVVRGSVDRPQ